VPDEFDAVIYNPPFTNTNRQGRRYSTTATRAMVERLQKIKTKLEKRDPKAADAVARGSIRPFFTPLTTGLLSRNGRLAKVIPATACTSDNGRAERQYIADNFHVEMVITSHDPKRINFSENTAVHECLLIGKRGDGNTKPTRFIQLAEYPSDVNAADQLIAAIENGDGVTDGVESSRVESSRVESSRVESSRVESSRTLYRNHMVGGKNARRRLVAGAMV